MSVIEMTAYVTSGMVRRDVVDLLLAHGRPMVSDHRGDDGWAHPEYPFRAFLRLRSGGRVTGPIAGTAQSAADGLAERLGLP